MTGDNGPAAGGGLSALTGWQLTPAATSSSPTPATTGCRRSLASSHTQWGISMTAGDVYTVAGPAHGAAASSGDGGLATSAMLDHPGRYAVDSSGDMLHRRHRTTTGSGRSPRRPHAGRHDDRQRHLHDRGQRARDRRESGDGGVATAALLTRLGDRGRRPRATCSSPTTPTTGSRRSRPPPAQYGSSMTAATCTRSPAVRRRHAGSTGDGGAATSALLQIPTGVAVDPAGDMYIADQRNSRVQEVRRTTGTQWGQAMTAGDIYTIAGQPPVPLGNLRRRRAGDVGADQLPGHDRHGLLRRPVHRRPFNNRVQEIAAANGTQWGQPMTGRRHLHRRGQRHRRGRIRRATAARPPPRIWTSSTASRSTRRQPVSSPTRTTGSARSTRPPPPSPIPVRHQRPARHTAGHGHPGRRSAGDLLPQSAWPAPPLTNATASGQYCTLPENIGSDARLLLAAPTHSPRSPATTFTYNSSGAAQPARPTPQARRLTISYGSPAPGRGNCPATANWCQTITSASGRALTIGYNSSNLVTSVTDPLGRAVDLRLHRL